MQEVPFETVRYGKVTAVDRKKCLARVLFEDRDNQVSPWLPVMQKNTMNHKFYWLPDIDEIAVCLFLSNGEENGLIIGTVYSDIDKPVHEISDEDKERHGVWFKDGTFIKYEHDTKKLEIECAGEIHIRANGNIYIDGPEIHLNSGGG